MQMIKLKKKFEKYLKIDPASPSGLVWNTKPAKNVAVGAQAGNQVQKGYYRLKLKGVNYYAHRVIAILAGLYDCEKLSRDSLSYQVDHINRQRDDNSVNNLRVLTASQNIQHKFRDVTV